APCFPHIGTDPRPAIRARRKGSLGSYGWVAASRSRMSHSSEPAGAISKSLITEFAIVWPDAGQNPDPAASHEAIARVTMGRSRAEDRRCLIGHRRAVQTI